MVALNQMVILNQIEKGYMQNDPAYNLFDLQTVSLKFHVATII